MELDVVGGFGEVDGELGECEGDVHVKGLLLL